jgi:hypothetical protein
MARYSFIALVLLTGEFSCTSFTPPAATKSSPYSTTTTTATSLNAAALIVQNKGGGHGELGTSCTKIGLLF